jgi:HlyD family secretion protein
MIQDLDTGQRDELSATPLTLSLSPWERGPSNSARSVPHRPLSHGERDRVRGVAIRSRQNRGTGRTYVSQARRVAACIAALAFIATCAMGIATGQAQPAAPAESAPASRYTVAAPGLVEPAGEEHLVASQVIGVIKEMRVEENDIAEAGQIIAVVENSEQIARLASARAELALRKAELDKALNGARPEELRQARAALAEMQANLDLARRDYDRKQPLTQNGTASEAALDLARSTLNAAEARKASMAERLALLEAGTRAEDIAAARAQIASAEADVALADSLLDKTLIRSPVSGTILRRLRVAGEAVTNVDPTQIAIVGDLRKLRVRAEVDETDVARVAAGQRVEITADAYPNRRFGGTVFRVSQRFGAKAVQTGRPAEKVDMKVLQVLIDLDPDVKLPVGLRVDAFVLNNAESAQR